MDKHIVFTVLEPYRKKLIVLMLFELCTGICAAGVAWDTAYILNGVFLHHMGFDEAAPYLQVLLFVICLRSFLLLPLTATADSISLAVRDNIRQQLHAALLTRSPLSADLTGGGELLTLALETTDGLDDFFSRFLPQLLEALVLLPFFFAIAAGADFWIAMIFLITLPIAPFLLYLIGRLTQAASAAQWLRLTDLSQGFAELLRGMSMLKIFNRSHSQLALLHTLSEDFSAASLHVLRLAFVSAFVLELITTLSIALISVSVGLRLLAGTLSFEIAFFALLISPEFYRPLRQSGIAFHAGMNAATAAKKLLSFIHMPDAHTSTGQYSMQTQMPPTLRFSEVSYHYPGRAALVLEKVSFDIPAGSFTVLTGTSGSGKSTVLRLLMQLDTPQDGHIYINNLRLANIEPQNWHQHVTYVPQDPHLFRASLRDNVTLFAKSADEAAVQRALQAAALTELAEGPTGAGRMLGEGYAALSAGQMRRLGLARAIYRSTPILLLDEITAGLDAENERLVLAAIIRLCHRRTIVMAAHRPSVLKLADKIISLDAGRILPDSVHSHQTQSAGGFPS